MIRFIESDHDLIVPDFQINQLCADLTPLETIGLVVSERMGHGGDW